MVGVTYAMLALLIVEGGRPSIVNTPTTELRKNVNPLSGLFATFGIKRIMDHLRCPGDMPPIPFSLALAPCLVIVNHRAASGVLLALLFNGL